MQPDIESTEATDVELPEGRPRTPSDLAAAKLRTALLARSGYVVVTADAGEGAEALLNVVEARLRTFRSVRVSGRILDPEAVVRALWRDGAPPFPARVAMRTLIGEARAAGLPIVVAITEAEAADPAQVERVRLTLEGTPDAAEIVHVVLLGGPALVDLLRRPEARAIVLRLGGSVQVPAVATTVAARAAPARPRRVSRVAIGAVVVIAAAGAVAAGIGWFRTFPPAQPAPLSRTPATVLQAAPVPEPLPTPPPVPAPQPIVVPDATGPKPETTEPAAALPALVPPPAAAAPQAPVATPAPGGAALQVAAFVRAQSAETLRAALANRFPIASVSPATRDGTTYHRVRVGGFASEGDLDAAARALRAEGYAPVRVRIRD